MGVGACIPTNIWGNDCCAVAGTRVAVRGVQWDDKVRVLGCRRDGDDDYLVRSASHMYW